VIGRRTHRLAASAVLLLLVACEDSAHSGAAPRGVAKRFSGDALVRVDPAAPAGTLRGVVRFLGEPPARRPLPVASTAGCGDAAPLSDALVVREGLVANVLVHAKRGVKPESVSPPSEEAVVLDQRGCTYSPHVVALRVGQPLSVRNSDPITHNVNAKPERSARFNVSQTPGARELVQRFERSELAIPIGCDIHPWMSARIHVLDDDAFALTADSGEFVIGGLSPGAYRFEALHETLGAVEFDVTLDGEDGASVEIEFRRASDASN